jgi:hypothetical protein
METKAFDKKVRAELQKAKSQLDEFEARSKAEDEQAAMQLVNQLKNTHRQIDQKRQEIEMSAIGEMEQEQAEIDANIDKLRQGLAELDRKLNPGRNKKVS